jgi:hypothetical protein
MIEGLRDSDSRRTVEIDRDVERTKQQRVQERLTQDVEGETQGNYGVQTLHRIVRQNVLSANVILLYRKVFFIAFRKIFAKSDY